MSIAADSREFLARSRAWLSLLLLLPIGCAAVLTPPHVRFDSLAEYAFELVGWLIFLAGACLRWWATLFIGGRKHHELVTTGPYSICRNPLYLGTLLMTLSVGVFFQSLTLVVAITVVGYLYLLITVPAEERRLEKVHGEKFTLYRQRVPMLLPKFSLHEAPSELNVRLVGLWAEFLRMLQWAGLPLLCYFVEHLRVLPWWPTPLWMP